MCRRKRGRGRELQGERRGGDPHTRRRVRRRDSGDEHEPPWESPPSAVWGESRKDIFRNEGLQALSTCKPPKKEH